jgi:predicted RNA binding protein YcfA (HicA-like mRNA interferase family)
MPKLRQLSGSDVVAILAQFGFKIHSQKGSHIKLRRIGEDGNETLIIPNHKRLDMGTCRGIMRQASQYIPTDELAQYFYAE